MYLEFTLLVVLIIQLYINAKINNLQRDIQLLGGIILSNKDFRDYLHKTLDKNEVEV